MKFTFLLILTLFTYQIFALPTEEIQFHITDLDNDELRITMQNNGGAFLNEINRAFHSGNTPQFNPNQVVRETELSVGQIWGTSPFYISETFIVQSVSRLSNGFYEVRNIAAHFVDPMGEKHFQEIVIEFTPTGMVRELKIGLESHRYQALIRQGVDVRDVENRQMILSFVEEFRTSYNRQDIDFIEKVFSDQALIIVGRVIEAAGQSAYENQVSQKVELLQFTKDEYIQRLRGIFSRNEWINVVFEEIRIREHPSHDNLYGVYLTQNYSSSTYSDEGFLFILIDFRDSEHPQIHVRTWEPKNAVREGERFSIGDIRVL